MRCDEFRELMPRLMGNKLDGKTRRELGLHMAACDECAALVENEDTWLGVMQQALDHKAPADLRRAILADGAPNATAGDRRRLWSAIARYVVNDMTWRTWAEAVALVAVVTVAVNWWTGRPEGTPALFSEPGPVVRVGTAPDAARVDADGSFFLTDRLF